MTTIGKSSVRKQIAVTSAFTLLEVMIASGIFFMAVFTILALVSSALHNVQRIQQPNVDGGIVLADLVQTNVLTDGDSESGSFGDAYPGYNWTYEIHQVGSNGWFEVDCAITHQVPGINNVKTLTALLYRPDSPPGAGYGK